MDIKNIGNITVENLRLSTAYYMHVKEVTSLSGLRSAFEFRIIACIASISSLGFLNIENIGKAIENVQLFWICVNP